MGGLHEAHARTHAHVPHACAHCASLVAKSCSIKDAHAKAPAEFKAYYECLDYYRCVCVCWRVWVGGRMHLGMRVRGQGSCVVEQMISCRLCTPLPDSCHHQLTPVTPLAHAATSLKSAGSSRRPSRPRSRPRPSEGVAKRRRQRLRCRVVDCTAPDSSW